MARPAAPVPALDAAHFLCPHCEVDSHQEWQPAEIPRGQPDANLRRSRCLTCSGCAYWVASDMVWPRRHVGAPPSEDMPDQLEPLYLEAREVAAVSPRAGAALLRLLIEQLVRSLDAGGKPEDKLFDRVNRLASAGDITRRTVEALTAVRWGGNDAVHEGRIDPSGNDDLAVVELLFDVVNRIVEDTTGMARRVQTFNTAKTARRRGAAGDASAS